MKYIVELEVDEQKATPEEISKIFETIDALYEEEGIPCHLKTNTARVFLKEREDQYTFAKVWKPLYEIYDNPKIYRKLKRATWENGEEKGDLMKEFFCRRTS